MANNTTTVNINETREVVIEPEKPVQPRLKQYVALLGITVNKKAYKTGDQVRLTEADALAYLASNQITPLEVALRSGIYPVSKETLSEKIVEVVTGEEIPDTKAEVEAQATAEGQSSSGGKKSFLGNALRDAIQKKKAETNPAGQSPLGGAELAPTKVDAAKLAAIKAGGKK